MCSLLEGFPEQYPNEGSNYVFRDYFLRQDSRDNRKHETEHMFECIDRDEANESEIKTIT